MSLFADILDVHTEWLTRKGYDQQALGLTGTPNDPLNRLEDAFKEIVTQNFWARKPLEFELDTTGRFGRHQQERVEFRFHYRYDPNRVKLNLLSLRAELGDQSQTWLITGDRQHLLPDSQLAFEQLKRQLTMTDPQQKPTSMRLSVLLFLLITPAILHAQMDRTEMLDQIEKLQLYIAEAQNGYQIVHQGLTTIGRIKQGDFNLHQVFFNALQLVNPAIRSEIEIADILTMEAKLQSKNDIAELTGILTNGNWQMDDAQRLAAINRLYAKVTAEYQSFLRYKSYAQILALQTSQTSRNLQNLTQLIKP
jgi:hypothetical protein